MAKKTKPVVRRNETLDRLEIRIGRMVEVVPEPSAPKPAYRMTIDFGEGRIRQSVGRFTRHPLDETDGRLVVGVLNFGPVTIGSVTSDVLVLGVQYPKADSGEATFLTPWGEAEVGGALGEPPEGDQQVDDRVDKGETFDPLEIRVGRVMGIETLGEDALGLDLDFGKFGRRPAVIPATHRTGGETDGLEGDLLLGVLNFEPETIHGAESQVHLLTAGGVFLSPAHPQAKIGGKLF